MKTHSEAAPQPLAASGKGVNAAFFYAPEGFDTSAAKLMGRHAAGEGFMNAFVAHSGVENYYCFSKRRPEAVHFYENFGKKGPVEAKTIWVPTVQPQKLSDPGCVFLPGPDLSAFAWQRRHLDQRAYSLCGITHTTSSDRIMDAIGNMLLAPLQPWDAVICTTNAAKGMVENELGMYHDYLCQRLGAQVARSLPQLPVIPLGVECDNFVATPETDAFRQKYRQENGIADDDVAVLYMGRLSYHAKAHPFPMYAGLEAAAQKTGKKIHLLLVGWFANKALQEDFIEGAALICPSVKLHIVDGRPPEIRKNIWFAADIFCSLSDNIQETFGLTPIEGMAAGLPCVVSDWNGYKETVRDGLDGFRVPTYMPEPGPHGEELALRHAQATDTYDYYVGKASMPTAVDIPATAEAFIKLVEDPALRRKMGLSAQIHARSTFDWRVVIAAYQALWAELAELRKKAPEVAPRLPNTPPNPLRADPYALFQHYPTELLTGDTRLLPASGDILTRWKAARTLDMATYCDDILLPAKTQEQLLGFLLESGGATIDELAQRFKDVPSNALIRTLGWTVKLGLAKAQF